jgi:hypothetical protein
LTSLISQSTTISTAHRLTPIIPSTNNASILADLVVPDALPLLALSPLLLLSAPVAPAEKSSGLENPLVSLAVTVHSSSVVVVESVANDNLTPLMLESLEVVSFAAQAITINCPGVGVGGR